MLMESTRLEVVTCIFRPSVRGRVLTCARVAGTATGRKGSMWAAVPAAAACDAVGDDDSVPLGPGQMPPRNTMLPPLHAEINISIIMVKGQLELEVSMHLHTHITKCLFLVVLDLTYTYKYYQIVLSYTQLSYDTKIPFTSKQN